MLRCAFIVIAAVACYAQAPQRLSQQRDYDRQIDPLLQVKDFGIVYSDDGAADASVLRPRNSRPLNEAILSLIRLQTRAIPVLIDCLSDQRVSSVSFEGNNIARKFPVAIGYVCLDLLVELTSASGIHIKDCSDDGLGACMKTDFYFRPTDYSNCWPDHCQPRPWVFLVQSNWRQAYLARRLKFIPPHKDP